MPGFSVSELDAIEREGVEYIYEGGRGAIIVGAPLYGCLADAGLTPADLDLDRTDRMVRQVEDLLRNRCRATRMMSGAWIIERLTK